MTGFNKVLLAANLLMATLIVQSQNLELGKVSIDELKEQRHPNDSSAGAAILFSRGHTHFEYSASKGFFTITEVRMRVKIYKKSGYDWARERVLYYTGSDEDQTVAFSKVVTYNLVNGQIQKTKGKNENEFTEKATRDWSYKKLTMPDVREGSIVEYMFTLTSPYITNLFDWEFQSTIPVNFSEYKVSIPDYFKFGEYTKGFLRPQVTTSSSRRDFSGVSNEIVNKQGGFRFERGKYAFDCPEITTTYVMTDIAAMKEEKYVNNINNYTASVSHELAAIRYPDSPEKRFAKDWESVSRQIYAHPDFGFELDKRSYFDTDLQKLKTSDRVEMIFKIYDFVKSRMSWTGTQSYLCDKGVRKAYLEQSGNAAEINLILIAMLREAGITANPVVLSTRDNGIALFPNRTAFNYVIAAVEINNDRILLDATDKKLIPGMLPVRALNWTGQLIAETGQSTPVGLMSSIFAKETHNISANLASDGGVSGKVRTQHADYEAYLMRTRYFENPEKYTESLEKQYHGISLDNFKLTNETDLGKPVIETYDFVGFNGGDAIGDRIYFSPMLFFATSENPFKQEKREYPVDFTVARQQKLSAVITIPPGFGVESMPSVASVEIENKICDFKYNIAQSGSQIQLNFTVNINQPIVSSANYESLKAFFRTLIEKENEKIVLKKI